MQTLFIVEHNMRVIMELAQRIVALQLGEVIADAPPSEIVRDPRVIEGEAARVQLAHEAHEPGDGGLVQMVALLGPTAAASPR